MLRELLHSGSTRQERTRFAVRMRWQFAHTSSQRAISALTQPISLADQPADLHRLRADVIELEHGRIHQAAVGAGTRRQDLNYMCPPGRAAFVACSPGLLPVQVAAPLDVRLAALLASRLPAMEV